MFYAVLYPSHRLNSVPNFTEIVPGEPFRRWLNTEGLAKYSDVLCQRLYFGNGAKYGFGYGMIND